MTFAEANALAKDCISFNSLLGGEACKKCIRALGCYIYYSEPKQCEYYSINPADYITRKKKVKK